MNSAIVRVYHASGGQTHFSIVPTKDGFRAFVVNKPRAACTRECKFWSTAYAEGRANHFEPLNSDTAI